MTKNDLIDSIKSIENMLVTLKVSEITKDELLKYLDEIKMELDKRKDEN